MIASQPVENIDFNNFNVNDQTNIEREFSQGSSRQIYKIGSRVRTIDNESSTSEYGRVTSWDSARSLYTASLDEAPSTVRSSTAVRIVRVVRIVLGEFWLIPPRQPIAYCVTA